MYQNIYLNANSIYIDNILLEINILLINSC